MKWNWAFHGDKIPILWTTWVNISSFRKCIGDIRGHQVLLCPGPNHFGGTFILRRHFQIEELGVSSIWKFGQCFNSRSFQIEDGHTLIKGNSSIIPSLSIYTDTYIHISVLLPWRPTTRSTWKEAFWKRRATQRMRPWTWKGPERVQGASRIMGKWWENDEIW